MKAKSEYDQKLLSKAMCCTKRVAKVEHEGRTFWVKRKEVLSLRFRLQKGSPSKTFERERSVLQRLAGEHAYIPRIVAEGPDFFVLPDYGPSLQSILQARNGESAAEKARAFSDGAAALADLHAHGLSHGRPSLKDICWRDGQATLIDFENYRDAFNSPYGQARDVIGFFFNGLYVAGRPVPELETARDVYRAHDANCVWQSAQRLVHRMRWVDWLTKPIQMRGPGKAREFKAIPLTRAFFNV